MPSILERKLTAGIDKITIDDDAHPLAQSQSCLFAKVNGDAGRRPGANQVGHEYGRIQLEHAARRACFGKAFSFEIFAQTRGFPCLRLGGAQSGKREGHAGGTHEGASAERTSTDDISRVKVHSHLLLWTMEIMPR